MAKGFIYTACFLTLATITAFLLVNLYVTHNYESRVDDWALASARAAEAVAAKACSGHGRAFLDSIHTRIGPSCECNSCYGGFDCSLLLIGCTVDVVVGDPLYLEPYWMQQRASAVITVSPWHRMSYRFPNASVISVRLEDALRRLHEVVGNANTQGRRVVFGAGSTHLINAAIHALALDRSNMSTRAKVVATAPFYPTYKTQTDWFRSSDYEFAGDTNMTTVDPATDYIEIVTSPSNPFGFLEDARLQGPRVQHFYDHAYYWPQYTPIPAPGDADIMLFSLSKVTGHAGTRFGWAWVKNETVHSNMASHVSQNIHNVPRDNQLRILKIVESVIDKVGTSDDMFKFGYETLRDRWAIFTSTFQGSTRFSIQPDTRPERCSYFKGKFRAPTHGYGWVKCEREEDKNCYEVLKAEAHVEGQPGVNFLSDEKHVRLSLVKTQDEFNLMITRLAALISRGNNVATI